jgi:hypothetical protein
MMIVFVLAILAIPAGVPAGTPPDNAATSPAFGKLKSLAGTWKGTDSEGKPVRVTYSVVSAGTAVMERLDMGETEGMMITMYHPDGTKLMMTHYCSMGNEPRMRASGLSADGKTISFKLLDVANMATPKEDHMKKLVLTFKDDSHFAQEWTMSMSGKPDHAETFAFERVKE